ncbi:hypothetical protein FISHEDRAFT_70314 [Fistulina hepatica ATCC 64428]|uniref:Uncharacterized protein n=1 Tax=Fistulina hepatica ATCC 64428 TaxID=1128425 RepID=A0A0D7AMR8_9AGAR|nr:hypothetical protein FISHEDRAFT_70314 [Fistulina hepatica ATCC 64428]
MSTRTATIDAQGTRIYREELIEHRNLFTSPYVLSPIVTTHTSYISNNTAITSPQSSASYQPHPRFSTTPSGNLAYPPVPPPSLSSAFASPIISYHVGYANHSGDTSSAVKAPARVAVGLRNLAQQQHAHAGVSRRSSQNLPSTSEVLNEHDEGSGVLIWLRSTSENYLQCTPKVSVRIS